MAAKEETLNVKLGFQTKGYLYTESVSFVDGITVSWKGQVRSVIRYPLLVVICSVVALSIIYDNLINLKETMWFTKVQDYNYSLGAIVFVMTIHLKKRKIAELSEQMDHWRSYPYLQDIMERSRQTLHQKLYTFNYYYLRCFLVGSVTFCLTPIGRYTISDDNSAESLLLFKCWTPLPVDQLWGFFLIFIFQVVLMASLFTSWFFIIRFMIAFLSTVGSQLDLIGNSLVTIKTRGIAIVNSLEKKDDEFLNVLLERVLLEELTNSVAHYQRVYRLAKEGCKLFVVPINICVYSGMVVMVIACAKIATEREDKFIIFQAVSLALNILVNQYIVSHINQILLNKMEELQVVVYDSPWYTLPVSCRNMIHMMQIMVIKPPSIKTVIGDIIDMKFFLNLLQSSYYFVGALLSTNSKY